MNIFQITFKKNQPLQLFRDNKTHTEQQVRSCFPKTAIG